jgi:hypothetical protein
LLNFEDALFSLSYSDFSEEARLYLTLFYIVDRVSRENRAEYKRLFFFAGHALDSNNASYSYRELANYVLQLSQSLLHIKSNMRLAFIPNLSSNQITELALLPTIDVFEALSVNDWSKAATLAAAEQVQFMKCAVNGALLFGPDSDSNLQTQARLRIGGLF